MSKVSDIMDQGALGIKTRLVGVVDPQESKDIKLDSDKQLKETFVEVGDEVKKGDPLFSYDVEAMKQKIQEADLELEEMNNTLQTMNQQLNELNVQASKAKESEKQAYNLQILSAQNSIHKQEYNISVKQLERAQLEKNVDNAVMTSILITPQLAEQFKQYPLYSQDGKKKDLRPTHPTSPPPATIAPWCFGYLS